MKKIYSLLFLVSFPIFIFSQQIIVNGKESDGKLKWKDYTGKVDENSEYVFFTNYNYKVEDIKFKPINNTEIIIEDLKTKLELNPNSWAIAEHESKYLLNQAQGSFNFGLLTVKELKEILMNKKFSTENYHKEIEKIIKETGEKYNQKAQQFHQETKDHRNKAAREKWEKYFRKELPEIYN